MDATCLKNIKGAPGRQPQFLSPHAYKVKGMLVHSVRDHVIQEVWRHSFAHEASVESPVVVSGMNSLAPGKESAYHVPEELGAIELTPSASHDVL